MYTVADPQFQSALRQLHVMRFPVTTAHNINRMYKQIDKGRKDMQEPYIKLLKEHCYLEEDGSLTPQKIPAVMKDGKEIEPEKVKPDTYTVKPENEEAFKKDMEEFMSIEIEIQSNKIKLTDLVDKTGKPVELSCNVIGFLEPIIDDVPGLKLA